VYNIRRTAIIISSITATVTVSRTARDRSANAHGTARAVEGVYGKRTTFRRSTV